MKHAKIGFTGLAMAASVVLSACTASPAAEQQASAPAPSDAAQISQAMAARFDFRPPYFGGPLPGGERLIHPEPVAGDARTQADIAANARGLAMRGTPRWQLAMRDANLGTDWYSDAFSCTAGVSIAASDAPAVANVVRRAGADFARSTSAVKKQFMRERPFMVNGEESCTPEDEKYLRDNGSYPSGHSAIGYGTGLVLAAIFPGKAADLVVRGRGFGNSRWVCNVHWLSDVEEGRAFATATFARLQSDPQFTADLAAAQEEAKTLLTPPDPENCALEAAALARN